MRQGSAHHGPSWLPRCRGRGCLSVLGVWVLSVWLAVLGTHRLAGCLSWGWGVRLSVCPGHVGPRCPSVLGRGGDLVIHLSWVSGSCLSVLGGGGALSSICSGCVGGSLDVRLSVPGMGWDLAVCLSLMSICPVVNLSWAHGSPVVNLSWAIWVAGVHLSWVLGYQVSVCLSLA